MTQPGRRSAGFTVLFLLLAAAGAAAAVELGSRVYYERAIDPVRKSLVTLAMYPERKLPLVNYVPNTLWHHDLREAWTNSKRTLGPDFQMPKPEGIYRVLCLGDSTSALPAHHPKILQEWPGGLSYQGKKVEIVNAGIPSHCSAFTLSYFSLRLVRFQPDMVLLKVGYNDYLPFTHDELEYDYTPAFPQPFTLEVHDRRFWELARHSCALRLLGLGLLDLPGMDFLAPWSVGSAKLAQNSGKYHLYTENIRSILQLCKARGIRVMLLDLPVNEASKKSGLPEGYVDFIRDLNMELGRAAEAEQVVLIETVPFITQGDFMDEVHLLPLGGQKVAEAVIEKAGFERISGGTT